MTIRIGDHICPADREGADWTVDAFVGDGLIEAHDRDGLIHTLSVDQVMVIGRHRQPEDVVLRLPGEGTERGMLADVHMGNPRSGGGAA